MSSRSNNATSLVQMTTTLALVLAVIATACNRGAQGSEERVSKSRVMHRDTSAMSAGVEPKIDPRIVFGNIRNPYDGNPSAIATGRQLFTMYNCAGCHSGYAGGGMGPSLRDSLWRYGQDDVHVFATIVEGRPAGMPAWGAKIPEDQIWKIIAYLRTLGTPNEPVKPPMPARSIGAPPN